MYIMFLCKMQEESFDKKRQTLLSAIDYAILCLVGCITATYPKLDIELLG